MSVMRAGLQVVPASARPSAAAVRLAQDVLRAEVEVDEALERLAEHALTDPRVGAVAVALTTFSPADESSWVHLGARAWLRQWRRPGSACTVLPGPDAGPQDALTMPWISEQSRRHVAVLADVDLLPPEAAQDARELARCSIHSCMTHALLSGASMFGSLSVGSEETGPWSEVLVADVRLLSAALTSRMSAEAARRSLADAIVRGDQVSAVQQQFFAATGHELRTPLSAVLGYAEVLQGDAEDLAGVEDVERLADFVTQVHKDAGIIVGAGEQLLAIVEDLLSTARLLGDGGRETVVVAEAVQDVVHWVRTPAATAEVLVGADVDPALVVAATPAGVRQVLTNLVGNAVAHNRRGGTVAITATSTSGEGGEARVRISVKDTGPGLTPRQLSQVFEPFVRFAEPGVRGTGLGLSLARSVAERDGGRLGVDSRPGEGSTFWIDLPAPIG
ncbi:HAMP domain-containing sensor histidine kinase [Nocardioides sp. 31GB23]|uniref:sensor histidine kinase n=1 Tax=Nocardioides sp. 31GB23 TaxID=3156065 RepID=UPI0032AF9B1F